MEKVALSKTQVFLANASLFYKDVCPEQARFLMWVTVFFYLCNVRRDYDVFLCCYSA